ncbi:NAD-dependent epimerase/dehydratase family protein [Mucilaginibacter sp.]
MRSVLVTGINGFLGSQMAKQLQHNFNVVGLEYATTGLHRLADCNFKVYSSADSLEPIFAGQQIDSVIHTATLYKQQDNQLSSLLETNIVLPVKLYQLAEKYQVTNFINTDSFFNNPAYNYSYLAEYTLSKRHVLEWLKAVKGKCNVINMKLFHIYGKHDAAGKFIPDIIGKLKDNISSLDLTSGEQVRDFIYAGDVINAFEAVLNHFTSQAGIYKELEVGTGIPSSIKTLVNTVHQLTQSATQLHFGALPMRENEIMHAVANIDDLLALGWKPEFTLGAGLLEVINSQ